MAWSVRDTALLLQVMAVPESRASASAEAAKAGGEFLSGFRPDALKGMRIGVMRFASDVYPETTAVFERAMDVLRGQGAVLVEIRASRTRRTGGALEVLVLKTEMKAGLNACLATTDPVHVRTHTLADLIAFDRANAAEGDVRAMGAVICERPLRCNGEFGPM